MLQQHEHYNQQHEHYNQQPPSPAPNTREHIDHNIKRFRKLNTPISEGGSDPMADEDWMKKTEVMNNYVRISDIE